MNVSKIREIARVHIEDLFNTTIDNIIEKTFEFKCPDEYLISTHFAFREVLNKTKGSGRGIEGFSELWYLLYIKKFLEKFLKIEFENKKEESHYYEAIFNGNKLILSSDIPIHTNFKLQIHNDTQIRPDIFIGIKRDKLEIIPVAILEIKLYQEDSQDIEEKVVNRFIEMKDTLNKNNTDLPFFIFLYLQHSQYKFKNEEKRSNFNIQLKRFKSLFGEEMLMVNRILKWDTKYENKIEGSINQIMDKIILKLNSY